MIVVDTSALVAIAFDEPECAIFQTILKNTEVVLISSVSVVEARMVIYRRLGEPVLSLLNNILDLPNFEIIPPSPAEIDIAHQAFVTYGKGSGHPAQLNFGDLFSYALAKSRDVPLLFKGDDFVQTDVLAATAS